MHHVVVVDGWSSPRWWGLTAWASRWSNALNTADIALGFEAGLAIVLAIMLDRICKQPDAKKGADA